MKLEDVACVFKKTEEKKKTNFVFNVDLEIKKQEMSNRCHLLQSVVLLLSGLMFRSFLPT